MYIYMYISKLQYTMVCFIEYSFKKNFKVFSHNAPTHEMDKDTLLVRCQMH